MAQIDSKKKKLIRDVQETQCLGEEGKKNEMMTVITESQDDQ